MPATEDLKRAGNILAIRGGGAILKPGMVGKPVLEKERSVKTSSSGTRRGKRGKPPSLRLKWDNRHETNLTEKGIGKTVRESK